MNFCVFYVSVLSFNLFAVFTDYGRKTETVDIYVRIVSMIPNSCESMQGHARTQLTSTSQ